MKKTTRAPWQYSKNWDDATQDLAHEAWGIRPKPRSVRDLFGYLYP